jgi:hypothetical protein
VYEVSIEGDGDLPETGKLVYVLYAVQEFVVQGVPVFVEEVILVGLIKIAVSRAVIAAAVNLIDPVNASSGIACSVNDAACSKISLHHYDLDEA